MRNTALQSGNFSAKDALREAVAALQHAGIETASLDARVLLQHVLGVSREQLVYGISPLTPEQNTHYRELVNKRAGRQPVSQLTGAREFWGMNFAVTGATLDPRPDSETLIEAVLERIPDRRAPLALLDLGTGTGCLLIALLKEYEHARGIGVDISEAALEVARGNAETLRVAGRASFVPSHWGEKAQGPFDVVIANPPYIPSAGIATLAPEVSRHEPKTALDGGPDGLDGYREILPQLPRLLAPQGLAALEIGAGQAQDVAAIAADSDMHVSAVKKDLSGIERCILIRHSTNNSPT